MTDYELYWLAGLLEGEGSFMVGPPSAPNSVRIKVSMTDEDIIARVASLWGLKYHEIGQHRNKLHGWKRSFNVHLRGKRAVELMQKLLPIMGKRRQTQIERALTSYNPYLRNKLSPEQVREIKLKLTEGYKHGELARRYGVERSTVSHIKAGKRLAYR